MQSQAHGAIPHLACSRASHPSPGLRLAVRLSPGSYEFTHHLTWETTVTWSSLSLEVENDNDFPVSQVPAFCKCCARCHNKEICSGEEDNAPSLRSLQTCGPSGGL